MDQSEAVGTFGDWIARRRRTLDLTQDELARRAGCSTATLRKIEYGERRPSQQLANLLAEHLELPAGLRPAFIKAARGFLPLEHLTAPQAVLPDQAEKQSPIPRKAAANPPRNLPSPLTTLVGRKVELDSIRRLLQEPTCRLLTLTGPGGIGKSRLALEYAHSSGASYPDGVFFVALASLKPAEAILTAIASSLNLVGRGTSSLKEQLLRTLEPKRLLFVIDNMEHVLAGATLLGEILERAPGVKILATSRERLALQSEWALEVHGLPVPSSDQSEDLQESSAVSLFVQRARQVRAGFSPDPASIAAIIRLCRLLQGMPLGIELAASWVNVLSCVEIASEIENSLEFLTSPQRDLPERHRSLRGVVEQSWILLSDEEKFILQRLSIFRGGFTRQAAEQVAQANLAILASLSSKSLLNRDETGRYSLHELVRQYAAIKLKECPPDEAKIARAHAGYFTDRLASWEPMFGGLLQKQAVGEMEAEIDNLRLAWSWMVEQGDIPWMHQSALVFHSLYNHRGWVAEGIEIFEQAAQKIQNEPDPGAQQLAARLLYLQGYLHDRAGRSARSVELYQASLQILTNLPPSLDHATALRYLAEEHLARGEYDQAWQHGEQSVKLMRQFGSPAQLGICLVMLGYVHYSLGLFELSYLCFQESVELLRSANSLYDLSWSLQGKSLQARELGRLDEALSCAQESLELGQSLEDDFLVATVNNILGMVALAKKEFGQARDYFQRSASLLEKIYYPFLQTLALSNLGTALLELGQVSEAESVSLQAFRISIQIPTMRNALAALVTLANVRRVQGSLVPALALVLFALNHPATNQEARQRAEHCQAELLAVMDEGKIQAARALSAGLQLEEAISL